MQQSMDQISSYCDHGALLECQMVEKRANRMSIVAKSVSAIQNELGVPFMTATNMHIDESR